MNTVIVPWNGQSGFWWNETCSMILEHFGLPGEKYTSHPETDQMTFIFYDDHDALMCRLLISDRL